jgi:hypothetical protein
MWTPTGTAVIYESIERGAQNLILHPIGGGTPREIAPSDGLNRAVGFMPKH